MNARIIRQGVHGSSRPGFRRTGIFMAIDGIQRALTAGELLGKITANSEVVGEKLTGAPPLFPVSLVEHIDVEPPRETPENGIDFAENSAEAFHIHSNQGMGEATRRGQSHHVILGSLRFPVETDRQFVVQENLACFFRDIDQVGGFHGTKLGAGLVHLEKIVLDHIGTGKADLHGRVFRAEFLNGLGIERLVGAALSKDRNVRCFHDWGGILPNIVPE